MRQERRELWVYQREKKCVCIYKCVCDLKKEGERLIEKMVVIRVCHEHHSHSVDNFHAE